jgi:hypothetical protein
MQLIYPLIVKQDLIDPEIRDIFGGQWITDDSPPVWDVDHWCWKFMDENQGCATWCVHYQSENDLSPQIYIKFDDRDKEPCGTWQSFRDNWQNQGQGHSDE